MRRFCLPLSLGVLAVLGMIVCVRTTAQDANRLTYLDAPCDPYYVGQHFPKLTTPQWLGEPGVEAVVVLAIDDMRDSQHYENYLRPILDRLKQIDGRAGLSIMTNRASAEDEQLQTWLKEGVSIEVHTYDHPCPCLKDGDFAKAKETYDRCVDLMFTIPGNQPVAYRMPCCDSLNTPSPRFWSEVMHQTTSESRFLTIDSSVFQIFTPADPDLPGDLLVDENGERKFRKYLPFPSFVNTIENYPYPYVIGRMSWEFPCMVPSDWEAQNILGPNNPRSVEDMKTALDLTVIKQGVFNLVFHPHGWMRNDQVVELIDHAVEKHGSKVKFLSFREAHDRLNENLLHGESLRNELGGDNGARLLDVNADGYTDVVIGNETTRVTRLWDAATQKWTETSFPFLIARPDSHGSPAQTRVRFGIDDSGDAIVIGINDDGGVASYRFQQHQWSEIDNSSSDLAAIDLTFDDPARPLDGVYLRDVDGHSGTEILVSRLGQNGTKRQEVWGIDESGMWKRQPYSLPDGVQLGWGETGDPGVRFVDLDHDGDDDLVVSTEQRFAVYLFESKQAGWSDAIRAGKRGDPHPIPMIARDGKNNGAWFHSNHLWIQNEGTHRLPDLVDRMSFAELREPPQDEPQPAGGEPQPEPTRIDLRDNLPKPLSPSDALHSIKTRPELKIELIASEPLIQDPVAFDWGPDGELWVAEMGDYPSGSDDSRVVSIDPNADERTAHGTGRVRVLRDTDLDGTYDQSTVFLDGLAFPNAVKFYRDGILVMAAPDLIFASDNDGDDRADVVQLKLTGFVPGNQQHRANGLRWGLDGWLHIANGDSGGTVKVPGNDESIELRGFDLVYHPDQERIMLTTGQTQFGRSRDDWGNWFGGNNSNPMWQYVLDERDTKRNPFVATPNLRHEVPRQPGNAPVFPISVTLERFNDLHTANRITSACSPIIFRDTALGAAFYGNAFVCEPVHNLVHREIVRSQGPLKVSERADDEQRSEFLASTDSWFRPVMARTGPDGALWIADMYRLVIEHPEWIPQEWQARLDLRAGHDRGRIYRVIPRDRPLAGVPRLIQDSDQQLLQRLLSSNGTVRDLAQQLLIWREFDDGESLRALFANAATAQSRVQILWTIHCLKLLDEATLLKALDDQHPEVRRGAIRIAAQAASQQKLENSLQVLQKMIAAAENQPTIQLQLASSLWAFDHEIAGLWISEQLRQHNIDPHFRAALFSSIDDRKIDIVVREFVAAEKKSPGSVDAEVWRDVARTAAGFEQAQVLVKYLNEWRTSVNTSSTTNEILASAAVMTGLQNVQTLSELSRIRLNLVSGATELVFNDSLSNDRRVAALKLLLACDLQPEVAADRFSELISTPGPMEIQQSAIKVITQLYPDQRNVLLQHWQNASPSLRNEIFSVLMTSREGAQLVIDALETGTMRSNSLSSSRRQQLIQLASVEQRDRLRDLVLEVSTDRTALIEEYSRAIQTAGEVARGRETFKRSCANCHQLGDVGIATGPDLRALTDRSKSTLLTAILDPNRAVEDKYLDYAIITDDGHQYSGMLLSESSASLTLATAEGKTIDILRNEIESIGTSGQSLMPEGLEKELTPEQLADVIAFVSAQQLPAKQFSGNQPRLIQPNEDSELYLSADAARIYGPSLVFEPRYKNLGWWSSSEDYAIWDVEIQSADTYEVIFDYAVDASAAGDRFVVMIGDQSLSGTVASTGTWDDYQIRRIGRIKLEPGRYELVIRSEGPVSQAMIDLREVKLLPFLLDE